MRRPAPVSGIRHFPVVGCARKETGEKQGGKKKGQGGSSKVEERREEVEEGRCRRRLVRGRIPTSEMSETRLLRSWVRERTN